MQIKIWRRRLNRVDTWDLEDYLTHVLPNEVFASWPMESLKANAIMARSWAYYHIQNPKFGDVGAHVDDTTSSQVFNPNVSHPRTTQAVRETAGIVMLDADSRKPIAAFYSASCGGSGINTWNPRNIIGHTDCPCGEHGHERRGHGHGGCQWGTNYLAQDGMEHQEIISFYFKNYVLAPKYGAPTEENPKDSNYISFDDVKTVDILGNKFLVLKQ